MGTMGPYGATLYQKVEIFDIFGAAFPPPGAIEVKFCTAKRTHVPVGPAKFDLNRCNESPLRGENHDFWPVSKNNTGSLPLGGNPAGNKKKQTPHFRTYTRRALYDLPQTLRGDRARRAHHKRCHPFFDLIHSFSARGQNVDFWLLSKNNTGRLPLRGILPVIIMTL